MIRTLSAAVVSLGILLLQPALAATEGQLKPDMTNPGYHEPPSWFKVSFLDLRDDVAEASAAGKRLVVYFYQDGCPYCKKLLEENFGKPAIAAKTQQHFDVIAINMWGDREVTAMDGTAMNEKAFAKAMKVMFTPTLLFLDETGGVALRVNGYYPPAKFDAALDYVREKRETSMRFSEYFAQRQSAANQPAPKRSTGAAEAQYALNKLVARGDKPILVIFDQAACAACDELHNDILMRSDSRAQLARFHTVVLGSADDTPMVTPAGKSLSVKDWAAQLNVNYAPSLVFFDSSGAEVFRAEGYLKAFHVQSVMDYVASGAYREEPSFQRFIQARAERLAAQGVAVDLMQ